MWGGAALCYNTRAVETDCSGDEESAVFRLFWFLLGLLIGSWLTRPIRTSAPAQPSPAAPTPAPSEPVKTTHFSAAPPAPDDLLMIKGIGPVFVKLLHEAGITRYADLAAHTPESLSGAIGGRVAAERIERERWIEQARAQMAASG